MIEGFFLAIALAMDAFAVSIGLGIKSNSPKPAPMLTLAMLSGVYFGIFQGLMPLIGYFFGRSVLGMTAEFAPWIACVVLLILGIKMLYEALSLAIDEESESCEPCKINHKQFLTLAIATSIDAMGAGFTLNVLSVDAYLACLIIGVVTTVLSMIGVYLGKGLGSLLGKKLEKSAEILEGLVLMC